MVQSKKKKYVLILWSRLPLPPVILKIQPNQNLTNQPDWARGEVAEDRHQPTGLDDAEIVKYFHKLSSECFSHTEIYQNI